MYPIFKKPTKKKSEENIDNVEFHTNRYNEIINNQNNTDETVMPCPSEEIKQIKRWYSYGYS